MEIKKAVQNHSQRLSKIYDLYNFEEDTFINQEAYEQTMEQSETKTLSAPTGGYTEYGTYAGQYIYQTKKGSDTITIHVAKSAKKKKIAGKTIRINVKMRITLLCIL